MAKVYFDKVTRQMYLQGGFRKTVTVKVDFMDCNWEILTLEFPKGTKYRILVGHLLGAIDRAKKQILAGKPQPVNTGA